MPATKYSVDEFDLSAAFAQVANTAPPSTSTNEINIFGLPTYDTPCEDMQTADEDFTPADPSDLNITGEHGTDSAETDMREEEETAVFLHELWKTQLNAQEFNLESSGDLFQDFLDALDRGEQVLHMSRPQNDAELPLEDHYEDTEIYSDLPGQ